MNESMSTAHNTHELARKMLAWWGYIMAYSAKDDDLHFDVNVDYCTYHKPRTTLDYHGRFIGEDIEIKGSIDPDVALIIALYTILEENQDWCDKVLCNKDDYNEDQITLALRNSEALHRFKESALQILDEHKSDFTVTIS